MQLCAKSDPTSLVSVIVPTYNSAPYIVDAIESVLAQTYQNLEIIVIDDGSNDNARGVLVPYRDKITYLYQENRGVSAARNLGIGHAKGEYIAFLDADDIWLPGKLDRQMQFLEGNTNVALVFGDAELFDVNRTDIPCPEQRMSKSRLEERETPKDDVFELLLYGNFITTSTVMLRRSCLERVGGFDESLRSVEDRDLWLRIADKFCIGYIQAVLCRKRLHGSNISSDAPLAAASRIKVLERAVRRRWKRDAELPSGVRTSLAVAYFSLGYSYFDRGDYQRARDNIRLSLRKKIQAKAIMYYVATIMGDPVVGWTRTVKQRLARIRCCP